MEFTLDSIKTYSVSTARTFTKQHKVIQQNCENRINDRIESVRIQQETGGGEQGNGRLVGVDSQKLDARAGMQFLTSDNAGAYAHTASPTLRVDVDRNPAN